MEIKLFDNTMKEIKLGDTIKLINSQIGRVCFEYGSFGIAFDDIIDYDSIQVEMDKLYACCGNKFSGCFNDNFISLWELYWNFNCEENILYCVRKINDNN